MGDVSPLRQARRRPRARWPHARRIPGRSTMTDAANWTRLLLVQSPFPFRFLHADYFHRRIEHRVLLAAIGMKLRHFHRRHHFGSAERMAELLDCHPRRKDARGYFSGQTAMDGLSQRIRCLVETRSVESRVSVQIPPFGHALNAIENRNGTIDRILEKCFGIRGRAIAFTQSVTLRRAIGMPHMHRVLNKHDGKCANNGECSNDRLCKCQPIPMVPTHA